MSGAISGISLPFRADPVLLNPAPTQGGIRVTNPSVYSYSSLSAASCKPRARNAGRPARSVFQDTMIVSRGEAWIRKVDGCSAARSLLLLLLLLLPNMGLDRGRRSVRHPHTRALSSLPRPGRSTRLPVQAIFCPLRLPHNASPFGPVPGLIDQLHLHALFPLLSPLLQPSNYITLLAFAPTGPSKGVAAK
jgi:hypothetical protein